MSTPGASQRAWEAELRRMRDDAERLCEERIRAQISGSPDPLENVEPIVWEGSGMALDADDRSHPSHDRRGKATAASISG